MWLLIFSFAATALFALLALPFLSLAEVSPGENIKRVFDQSAISVIIIVVLLGPLVEEMIFRGWLTGTYQAIFGVLVFLGVFYGGAHLLDGTGLPEKMAVAAAALLLFALIQRLAKPVRPAWYTPVFPYFFWFQGIVFGGLHFTNIADSSLIVPLLMAVPMVIFGWILGYARIVLGFGSAWLLHMAYNVPAALGMMLILGAS